MIPLLFAAALAAEPADLPDRVLHDARPVTSEALDYPGVAKKLRLPPVICAVKVVVGTEGRVDRVIALDCPPVFLDAAQQSIGDWRYTPSVVDGEAVPFVNPLRLTYALPERDYRMITEESWARVDRDLGRSRTTHHVVGTGGLVLAAGGGVLAGVVASGGLDPADTESLAATGVGGGVALGGVALAISQLVAARKDRIRRDLWQHFRP